MAKPLAGFAVVLVALAWQLGPLAHRAEAKIVMPVKRYSFKIDPKTPLLELLPAAPDAATPLPPWLVQDLMQVPEVFFQKPETLKRQADLEPKSKEAPVMALLRDRQELDKAMERTAYVIAKINHLNQKGTDHFLKVLLENRSDLAGLPFVMGNACRQSKKRSLDFLSGVSLVRQAMGRRKEKLTEPSELAKDFWATYESIRNPPVELARIKRSASDAVEETRERFAALMQMLAPQDAAYRQGLVQRLADFNDAEATRALARLALFSFEESVRRPALAALKKRPNEDYTELLLAGLRHPWPPVARNAGDALVQLGRTDLVKTLAALLDEPDPRAPVETVSGGKKTTTVRELVRVNHHRNCLLCHAPGNTPDLELTPLQSSPRDIVTGAVPSPGQPLPPPSMGYDRSASPDILVRADVTYLRQDFSVLQPVKDAAPWPELQRFDFLVRTRTLTPAEVAAYRTWLKEQGPGYRSPQYQATRTALQALKAGTQAKTNGPGAAEGLGE
jgi:hypothetical protein